MTISQRNPHTCRGGTHIELRHRCRSTWRIICCATDENSFLLCRRHVAPNYNFQMKGVHVISIVCDCLNVLYIPYQYAYAVIVSNSHHEHISQRLYQWVNVRCLPNTFSTNPRSVPHPGPQYLGHTTRLLVNISSHGPVETTHSNSPSMVPRVYEVCHVSIPSSGYCVIPVPDNIPAHWPSFR